jgi:hypothetical protein
VPTTSGKDQDVGRQGDAERVAGELARTERTVDDRTARLAAVKSTVDEVDGERCRPEGENRKLRACYDAATDSVDAAKARDEGPLSTRRSTRVREWRAGDAWNLERAQRVDDAIRTVSRIAFGELADPYAESRQGRIQNPRFAVGSGWRSTGSSPRRTWRRSTPAGDRGYDVAGVRRDDRVRRAVVRELDDRHRQGPAAAA